MLLIVPNLGISLNGEVLAARSRKIDTADTNAREAVVEYSNVAPARLQCCFDRDLCRAFESVALIGGIQPYKATLQFP